MHLRDFDINLLTIMEAVWATRSVSMAARRLNLAQSTISAALNRLREQLDDELFVWNGHEMTPTPMAEQLMPLASDVLSGVRSMLEKATGTPLSVERRLVVATADYVVALFGAALIARTAAEAPNLVLDFVDLKPQLMNKTSLPDIDLFIFPFNALRVSGLSHRTLYQDRYVCVGRADNAALFEGMAADAFFALPHIGYSAMPRMTFSHESLSWEALGTEPDYRILMAAYLAFPPIVAQSDAVAIVPRRIAAVAARGLPLKWITPPVSLPELEISLVWKPGQEGDPAHQWLRNALVEIAAGWEPLG